MENNILYYFANTTRRLRFGDNRHIIEGSSHTVNCKPKLCSQGLHASPTPFQALQYAPGPIIYEVQLAGLMDIAEDKIAAQERFYIRSFDATDLLRSFARQQALINIYKIKPYTNEYDLIVQYLMIGDEKLQSAARSAAESAAGSAAGSAAESAWSAAAESAAGSAAGSAWSAAWSAAWAAAAWSAAGSVVWSAAERSVAWSAAIQKSSKEFNLLVQNRFNDMVLGELI